MRLATSTDSSGDAFWFLAVERLGGGEREVHLVEAGPGEAVVPRSFSTSPA